MAPSSTVNDFRGWNHKVSPAVNCRLAIEEYALEYLVLKSNGPISMLYFLKWYISSL